MSRRRPSLSGKVCFVYSRNASDTALMPPQLMAVLVPALRRPSFCPSYSMRRESSTEAFIVYSFTFSALRRLPSGMIACVKYVRASSLITIACAPAFSSTCGSPYFSSKRRRNRSGNVSYSIRAGVHRQPRRRTLKRLFLTPYLYASIVIIASPSSSRVRSNFDTAILPSYISISMSLLLFPRRYRSE